MATPRVLLLRAPGTNCDEETAFAFEQAGAAVTSVHVNRLIEEPGLGAGCQILCFPGGFSYGDDIAAGRILAQRLNTHLRDLVDEFCNSERLVLGICNGFQIMMRLGIFFPASDFEGSPATLTWNQQGRFDDRWVNLAVKDSNSVFLKGIDQIYLPMAHAEGRFVIGDDSAKAKLLANQQLGLRYCGDDGVVHDEVLPRPINPNGADLNIAGISDPSGRIFGMMPHPERYVDPTQHPYWTRQESLAEVGEGLAIFQNAVNFFA